MKFVKEPLLHFLIIGLLLFVVFDPQTASDNAGRIRVDNNQLLPLIMARNPRIGPTEAKAYLESMASEERARLVEDFVREEVMYREAVALGLDENNYSARRRLIAQLEYINQGFVHESLEIFEQDLLDHYQEHRDRYFAAAQITFTHVYFGSERHGEQAHAKATEELAHLNEKSLPFHLAASRGDHFLYHRNYVNKEREEVASHFGESFANDVFELQSEDTTWQGPLISAYGAHLVLVTSIQAGYFPALDEVRARVAGDVARVKVEEAQEKLYQEMRSAYVIEVVGPDETE
ncbi:MAG: peptidylprolyl isomerase [Pseudomonadales bacterium]|nr:peptidylprolyl isomerase [Pseudomonadales bacterium]